MTCPCKKCDKAIKVTFKKGANKTTQKVECLINPTMFKRMDFTFDSSGYPVELTRCSRNE